MLRDAAPALQAVGLKSRTTTRIVLKATPYQGAPIVHTVEKGHFIEVLAAKPGKRGPDGKDPSWYLLRDDFGLLGWAPGETLVPACAMYETNPAPIEGFCATGA